MKKILLTSLAVSSLLISSELTQEQIKEQIAQTKAEMSKLDAKVKELQSQLPPNENIITHSELGFVKTTGNTDTTTFNFELDMKKKWGKHNAAIGFDAQYGDNHGVETKNKFITEIEYGYSFTDTLSLTVLAGYRDDKFSGFDYQLYVGPGLKYIALQTPKHELSFEGNILYSQDSIDGVYSNKKVDYTSYRAKLDYAWNILDNLKFTQEATYRANFEDADEYFVYSKTALISKLTDILSAGISYKVDYINTPPKGKEHTDKTLTANLIVDF